MATVGVDFAEISDEEERIIIYGSVKESQPIHTEKLARLDDANVTSLREDENKLTGPGKDTSSHDDDNVSCNSDQTSLMYTNAKVIFTKYDYCTPWICCHNYCHEKCKIVVASASLVVIGIGLLGAGLVIWATSHDVMQAIVFLVIGIILLIPGVYHTVYLCYTHRGSHKKQGYSLYNSPSIK